MALARHTSTLRIFQVIFPTPSLHLRRGLSASETEPMNSRCTLRPGDRNNHAISESFLCLKNRNKCCEFTFSKCPSRPAPSPVNIAPLLCHLDSAEYPTASGSQSKPSLPHRDRNAPSNRSRTNIQHCSIQTPLAAFPRYGILPALQWRTGCSLCLSASTVTSVSRGSRSATILSLHSRR